MSPMATTDLNDVEALRERWVTEATESDLGLWWLADDVRDCLGDGATENEVRSMTLAALRPLLESGRLRAVALQEGGRFEVWTGDVDGQLARIVDGWRSVGKPTIGDVIWFIGKRR